MCKSNVYIKLIFHFRKNVMIWNKYRFERNITQKIFAVILWDFDIFLCRNLLLFLVLVALLLVIEWVILAIDDVRGNKGKDVLLVSCSTLLFFLRTLKGLRCRIIAIKKIATNFFRKRKWNELIGYQLSILW